MVGGVGCGGCHRWRFRQRRGGVGRGFLGAPQLRHAPPSSSALRANISSPLRGETMRSGLASAPQRGRGAIRRRGGVWRWFVGTPELRHAPPSSSALRANISSPLRGETMRSGLASAPQRGQGAIRRRGGVWRRFLGTPQPYGTLQRLSAAGCLRLASATRLGRHRPRLPQRLSAPSKSNQESRIKTIAQRASPTAKRCAASRAVRCC